jgi:hypothetical protein
VRARARASDALLRRRGRVARGGVQRRRDLFVARARQPELLDHRVHRARERLRRPVLQLHLDHNIRPRVRERLRALEGQPQHVLVRARAQRLVVGATRRDARRAHAVHRRGRRGQRLVQRKHARAGVLFGREVAERGVVLRDMVVPARASAARCRREQKRGRALVRDDDVVRPEQALDVRRNTAALFFAATSPECVWPQSKRRASATATDVLPVRAPQRVRGERGGEAGAHRSRGSRRACDNPDSTGSETPRPRAPAAMA